MGLGLPLFGLDWPGQTAAFEGGDFLHGSDASAVHGAFSNRVYPVSATPRTH